MHQMITENGAERIRLHDEIANLVRAVAALKPK